MKNLEIDIETYSSIDLSKCGVYKYAEAEDFEILLFGYSVDGGEVIVVDLAAGGTSRRRFLMHHRRYRNKMGIQCCFERVCLSRYLL